MNRPERNRGDNVKLEMTPMIDVVFQLLIFFVVTLKQDDILSHMDVSRPGVSVIEDTVEVPRGLVKIEVYDGGFMANGVRVGVAELDRRLSRLGRYNPDVSVIIKCTPDSPHASLVKLLDVCAKARLKNLSVFSI